MINIEDYERSDYDSGYSDGYDEGYHDAIEAINTSQKVIMKDYCPSECPRCKGSFDDYEECDDGYYNRAVEMERCPFCGQKLDWFPSQSWDEE